MSLRNECCDCVLSRVLSSQGVDKTDATVSAAGTFRTGALSPNGDKIAVGCLLRLEANIQVILCGAQGRSARVPRR